MVKGVDWSAPWLTPIRKLAAEVSTASNWRIALNAQAEQRNIRNHLNLPLHFIPQQELPEGTAYEAHISATGKVPTRDNLHDFFNALVWLIFPKIKAQLNGLHAKQIACSGTGKSRGAARDAATLFDENAALLTVADTPEGHAIVEALRAHQWHRLFLRERQQFMTHAGVCLFGHALMEKLVRPYKAITAHTLVCWVTLDFHQMSESEKCAQLDNQIADQLEQIRLLPAIFSPLPVLGIPGWWPDQTADFYADEFVFRLKRQGVV